MIISFHSNWSWVSQEEQMCCLGFKHDEYIAYWSMQDVVPVVVLKIDIQIQTQLRLVYIFQHIYVCMYNALRFLLSVGRVLDIMSSKTLLKPRNNSAKSIMSCMIHVALTMWWGGSERAMCITVGKRQTPLSWKDIYSLFNDWIKTNVFSLSALNACPRWSCPWYSEYSRSSENCHRGHVRLYLI